MKAEVKEQFFIDKWCAKHIRRVAGCKACLHYAECLERGESVCPSVIERNKKKKTSREYNTAAEEFEDLCCRLKG